MDRQLTERMVGAALLLGALVVVVPLILDGGGQPPRVTAEPDGEPIDLRTHTIHLDGAERAPPVPRPLALADPGPAGPSGAEPAAADPDGASSGPIPVPPVPVATDAGTPGQPTAGPGDEAAPAGGGDAPSSRTAAAAPEPAPATSPAPTTPPPASPSPAAPQAEPAQGSWYVQLGSFSSRDNANRLAANLEKKGFDAIISPLRGAGGRTLYRVRAGGFETREEAAELARRLAGAGFPGGQLAR